MRFTVRSKNGRIHKERVLAHDPIRAAEIVAEEVDKEGPYDVYDHEEKLLVNTIVTWEKVYRGRLG